MQTKADENISAMYMTVITQVVVVKSENRIMVVSLQKARAITYMTVIYKCCSYLIEEGLPSLLFKQIEKFLYLVFTHVYKTFSIFHFGKI